MNQSTQIDALAIAAQLPDSSMAWPWIAVACIAVVLWAIAHASRKHPATAGNR
jgi:hypothetical protein